LDDLELEMVSHKTMKKRVKKHHRILSRENKGSAKINYVTKVGAMSCMLMMAHASTVITAESNGSTAMQCAVTLMGALASTASVFAVAMSATAQTHGDVHTDTYEKGQTNEPKSYGQLL
jgi:hypothetical protein